MPTAAVQAQINAAKAGNSSPAAPNLFNLSMLMAQDKRTTEDRFWSKVDKSSSCWIWQGALSPCGYGQFSTPGKTYRAHRFSYALEFGVIPAGLFICHHCDTPSCVNPTHLFAGTNEDNMRDMKRKGRRVLLQKTKCSNGHDYTPENTGYLGSGNRYCKRCDSLKKRR